MPFASKKCVDCSVMMVGCHPNRVRCEPCRELLKRSPPHGLTPEQQDVVLAMYDSHTLGQIADATGASRTSIGRYKHQQGLSLPHRRYAVELKRQVVAVYEAHGGRAAAERFPGLPVRAIVTSMPHVRRAPKRWGDEEYAYLASTEGLLPAEVQARRLGRSVHGVRTAWFRMGALARGRSVHGLHAHIADGLCRPGYPTVRVPSPRRSRVSKPRHRRGHVLLWCEAGPWVHAWMPGFVHEAVATMAEFQRWLLRTDDPAAALRDMIAEAAA